jgi:hypothetical protein
LRLRWVAASPFKVPRFRKSIGERGNNKRPARPMSGGCAARKSPMWTGSSLAYGEILSNSADGAARFLNKAITRPDAVKIATTGIGVTTGTTGKGVTTGTTGRGLTGTTGRGLTTMTTNKGKIGRHHISVGRSASKTVLGANRPSADPYIRGRNRGNGSTVPPREGVEGRTAPSHGTTASWLTVARFT